MRYQKQVVKMAYDQAIKRNPDLKVDLIVDGGSEHHNIVVNDFLASLQGQINQLTALKDIAYSNSMVEAFHKLHKYQYLFPFDKILLNPEKLIQHMNCSIPD
jgi:methionine synthase II (cobalamin-independent)